MVHVFLLPASWGGPVWEHLPTEISAQAAFLTLAMLDTDLGRRSRKPRRR
jgi:hypothetical protein